MDTPRGAAIAKAVRAIEGANGRLISGAWAFEVIKEAVLAVAFLAGGALRQKRIAPGPAVVLVGFRIVACGKFPFGLGRQALTNPGAIAFGTFDGGDFYRVVFFSTLNRVPAISLEERGS